MRQESRVHLSRVAKVAGRSVCVAAALVASSTVWSQNLKPSLHLSGTGLNRYGSSGYLTIPTADIAPAGTFDFAVNRAFDPIFDQSGAPPGGNLMFVATPYENFEIGGRLAEYATTLPGTRFIIGGRRDLSGNVKFQFVKMPQKGMRAAFGIQDVAGGAVTQRGAYGVFTMDVGPLSASAGYMKRDSRAKSGAFGGVKLAVIQPLHLMADFDPYQKAIGARASVPLPMLPGQPVLSGTVARSSARFTPTNPVKTDLQLNLRFFSPPVPPNFNATNRRGEESLNDAPQWPVPGNSASADTTAADRLRALGFDAVSVVVTESHARVTVQNNRYKHSQYDAIAVALSSLTQTLPEAAKDIYVVLRMQGVPIAEVYANRSTWQRFMNGGLPPQIGRDLRITSAAGNAADKVQARTLRARSQTPITLRVDPVVRTFWGTEVGAIDAAVALRATLIGEIAPLANGQLLASVAGTSQSAKSFGFENGQGFTGQDPEAGLTNAMLHWGGWTGRDLFHLVSVGKFDHFYKGAAIESHWVNRRLPFDVDGTVSLRAGSFRSDGSISRASGLPVPDRQYLRVNASGYIPDADLTVSVGAGQFLGGDRGPSVDVTREFGGVSFGVTYRKTNRHFFGIQMGVPLTPRKGVARIGPIQVEGSNHFIHGARTSYAGKTQDNRVLPTAARFAELPIDAQLHWFDRGRLSNAQWSQNLFSSREFAREVLGQSQ